MNSSIKKVSGLKFILFLVVLHFGFIFLTFIFLRYRIISLVPLFFYGMLLFYGGFWLTKKKKGTVMFALCCGIFSQLPAIFLSLIILIGISTGISNSLTVFETFDFLLQVWHTTLAPLFPFLPSLKWLGTPLYYWFTVAFSFIYPLVIVLGAVSGQFLKEINIIKH
jgi:hypothetical protein